MKPQELTAQRRQHTGTNHSRRLRSTGQIPGIIYGHDKQPLAFSVDRHDLQVELIHGHRVLSMSLDGKSESFLVKEVQYDHLGTEPLHIDLTRVDLHETVRVQVVVQLRGTPKGTNEGGVLEQLRGELEVECRVSDIPGEIRANVAHLGVNESLTVAELELPMGVQATLDPGEVVAMVRFVADETEPAETEEGESAEPEIISRGKGEEEKGSQEA